MTPVCPLAKPHRAISRIVDEWAHRRGIKLQFIRPGTPVENAFIEASMASVATNALTSTQFLSLEQARIETPTWRLDYNRTRPHSALGNLTPEAYAHRNQVSIPESTKLRLSLVEN